MNQLHHSESVYEIIELCELYVLKYPLPVEQMGSNYMVWHGWLKMTQYLTETYFLLGNATFEKKYYQR